MVQRGPLFGTHHPVSANGIMHYITLTQYQSQEIDVGIIHRPCSHFTIWRGAGGDCDSMQFYYV